jgi:hypothetical protein
MTHHQTGALSWRNLTPEQRSEEMKRRQAVTREKRAAEVRQQMEKRYGSVKGPQNPNHPEHEAYVENMRQKALERWSDPNFREAQVQKMHDARDARDQLLNSEELQ